MLNDTIGTALWNELLLVKNSNQIQVGNAVCRVFCVYSKIQAFAIDIKNCVFVNIELSAIYFGEVGIQFSYFETVVRRKRGADNVSA